jgi:hypothetical protein
MRLKKGIVIHPEEISPSWEQSITGTDISVLGIHPVGGQGSHQRVLSLAEDGYPPEQDKILTNLIKKGIDIEYELHAMSLLLPRELFYTHSEYFRVNEKGERTPDYNLCPSNKDALDIVSDSAEWLAKNLKYSSDTYNFWLDDVFDASCSCNDCKHLTPSDQAMLIYNAVLRGLKRVNPNAKQAFLAYCATSAPPVIVEPEEGIFLEFAPFKRQFNLPMIDSENSVPAGQALDAINFFGHKNSKVLEYWLDNSMFSCWQKPPKKFFLNREVLEKDMEFYQKAGYGYITTFACYLGDDYIDLHGFPDLSGYINKK